MLHPCIDTYTQRCYSFASLTTGRPLDSIDGAFAWFDYGSYSEPDWTSGGHGNQTIWLGTTEDRRTWCEVGWEHGGADESGRYSYSTNAYSAYSLNGYYVELKTSAALGPYGTVHAFQILRVAGTAFAQAIMDYTYLGGCPITVPADSMEVGLEYTDKYAVNQGVTPHDLQVRNYQGGDWRSWKQAGLPEFGACVTPRAPGGPYFAWLDQDVEFTDSSNVVAGNGSGYGC